MGALAVDQPNNSTWRSSAPASATSRCCRRRSRDEREPQEPSEHQARQSGDERRREQPPLGGKSQGAKGGVSRCYIIGYHWDHFARTSRTTFHSSGLFSHLFVWEPHYSPLSAHGHGSSDSTRRNGVAVTCAVALSTTVGRATSGGGSKPGRGGQP